MNFSLSLVDLLGFITEPYTVSGQKEVIVTGFASLECARPGDLSFVQEKKFLKAAYECQASVLLVPTGLDVDAPHVQCRVEVISPAQVLSQLCAAVEPQLFPAPPTGVHASAVLADNVQLGTDVRIGAFSTLDKNCSVGSSSRIGNQVSIGHDCVIGEGVVIGNRVEIAPHSMIGDHCILHAGAVIGSCGFGYQFDPVSGRHMPIPQIGRVVLERNVEVGANTTIDRARIGETRIGEGTKIDNLVQIGHNVVLGKHCILCGQVGISGSVTVGDYVVFGGKVGVRDHVSIEDGVQIGAGSGIAFSITTPGSKVSGNPAINHKTALKIALLQKKIPDLFRQVSDLADKMEQLQSPEEDD